MDILTRQELYRLVWLEPIVKIAPRYGFSDRGMGKLCERYNIPVPPRGYWAKKAARKRVSQASLPEGDNVTITFDQPKQDLSEARAIIPPEIEFERDPMNCVFVETNARLLHPLVRAAAVALRGQKPDRDGIVRRVGCLDLRVSPHSLSRALRIMQALIRALEQRAHSVVVKERRTQATVLGETIEIFLRERLKRKVRNVTLDERRRRQPGLEADPYKLEPTGELLLNIDRGYGSTGAADGKNQRLEDCLNLFIETLIRDALRQKEWRAERERKERQKAEAERQQRAREKEQRQEEAQIERFDKLVEYSLLANRRRIFLAKLREAVGSVDGGSPLGQWLEWAEAYVEISDPLERFRNRGQTLKLYLSGYAHQLREIQKEGFEDPEPSPYARETVPAGVVLRDRQPDLDCLEDSMDLELPEEVLLPFEITEPGYLPRTFCIPARVLNEHLKRIASAQGTVK